MKPVYVVYITFYRGNRLPPFYIGWSTETNILKGYNGSVKSKEYQSIWQQERANHPELFKTIILQRFETSFEALTREELLHRFFKVPYNTMLINKSIGRGKFGTVGPKSNEHKQKISISKKKNPTFGMLGRHHTEESIQKMRRPHTPEHIEKIRLSKKGKKRHDSRINKKKDPLYLKEYRRVYRLKRKQRMREMGFTPEHKKNISLAKKGKPVKKQPTRSCPHCGKDGGYTVMARWHFDNCPNLTKPLLSSQS